MVRIQEEMVSVDGCDDETPAFRTVCSGCGLVHKFDRKYLGQSLMCPSCKKSFEAKEEEDSGACTSKIIRCSGKKKVVGDDDGESLRRLEEEEEDEGMMMTLAEMQSVLKRHRAKESHKKRKNTKKTMMMNHKEVTEIVDLECVPRADRKRDRGKLSEEVYMEDGESELYDFDKDRTPRSFKKGQIWAIYGGGGGDKMPRSYCLVSDVISLNPFRVWISWLDFERENLFSCSSLTPCGRFRVSERALIEQLKPFSHVVNCERAALDVYQIYPRKSSVWAVYTETNPGHQRRKTGLCELVVCLTMYSDAYGLSVAYLEKVSECSNLFKRREYGYNAVRLVEKDDVAAFLSHQVLAKKLQDDESRADLKECWVLDLASVPPNLVSTI